MHVMYMLLAYLMVWIAFSKGRVSKYFYFKFLCWPFNYLTPIQMRLLQLFTIDPLGIVQHIAQAMRLFKAQQPVNI